MNYVLLLILISCSSIKNPDKSGDGVFDKAMRNEECGLFDQFYDGCRKQEIIRSEVPAPVETPAPVIEE